jgi:hypothetical protein
MAGYRKSAAAISSGGLRSKLTEGVDELLGLRLVPFGLPIADDGYLLTVACPCGVVFGRWVTPEDANADLIAESPG